MLEYLRDLVLSILAPAQQNDYHGAPETPVPRRPRTTARRCNELEELAVRLIGGLCLLVPPAYVRWSDLRDPTNAAWNAAIHEAMWVTIALEQLGNMLRAKAGFTERGVIAEFFSDDDPPVLIGYVFRYRHAVENLRLPIQRVVFEDSVVMRLLLCRG